MRILLLASAFNSLTQRVFAELRDHGHTVSVELAPGDAGRLTAAVREHAPELVIAPMLTTAERLNERWRTERPEVVAAA